MTKKPFLYSNRGNIFPDVIKEGGIIHNKFNKDETIYYVQKIGETTYYQTIQKNPCGVDTHRFYELQGDKKNPAESKMINVKFQDREVNKLLFNPWLAEINFN